MMLMRTIRRTVCAVALVAAPAAAFDFRVTRYDDPAPDGCLVGDCSLREAAIAANVAADSDRILLSAGTYTLTLVGDGENNAATGDVDVIRDVEILGVGAGVTRIDAAGLGETPIFASGTGLDFVLRGVTLQNSDKQGLSLLAGTHTIEDCEFRDNGTGAGDTGIGTSIGSTLTLRRTTISGSAAHGLRVNQGSAAVENVTLSGNGGGELLVNLAPSFSCKHCTIVGAIGGTQEIAISSTSAQFGNSIVLGNCFLGSGGTIDSLGGNIEANTDSCTFDQATDQDSISATALGLGSLAANGGNMPTHLPIAASAANGSAVDATCLLVDQRGVARETNCESGSVEITNAPVLSAIFIDGVEQGSSAAWSSTVP